VASGRLATIVAAVALLGLASCTPAGGGDPSSGRTTTSAPAWIARGCYDGADSPIDHLDLFYSGPENVWGNVLIHPSTDGTCGDSPFEPIWPNAILRAPDIATARAMCLELLGIELGDLIPTAHWSMIDSMAAYGLPADAWICGVP
jgi:hypothetical protein